MIEGSSKINRIQMVGITVNPSVADRHRFDADLDPTFHFDTDPDLDPPRVFSMWELFTFI
jgi:hypothetical protein